MDKDQILKLADECLIRVQGQGNPRIDLALSPEVWCDIASLSVFAQKIYDIGFDKGWATGSADGYRESEFDRKNAAGEYD